MGRIPEHIDIRHQSAITQYTMGHLYITTTTTTVSISKEIPIIVSTTLAATPVILDQCMMDLGNMTSNHNTTVRGFVLPTQRDQKHHTQNLLRLNALEVLVTSNDSVWYITL